MLQVRSLHIGIKELGFCQTADKLFLYKYVCILPYINVVWEICISQVLKTSAKFPSAIAEILEQYCLPRNYSLAVGKGKFLLCWWVCVFYRCLYLIQSNVMGTGGKHPPNQKMHTTPASLLHVFVSAYSLSFQFSGFFIFFFFFSSFSAHIFPLFNPLVFSNFLLGLLTGHSLVLCWLIWKVLSNSWNENDKFTLSIRKNF